MAAHQVNVYFWLIDTIASGNLTREDINRRWMHCRYNDNHEDEFPERKIHRYKEEIQEIFAEVQQQMQLLEMDLKQLV